MRLLLVCRSMPWHQAGGLENHVWDLARGLVAAGHETHLLTTAPHDKRLAPAPPDGIVIHEIPTAHPGRYSLGTFSALARKAADLDSRLNFDVIHAQGFAANAFGQSLARKTAITVHGTLTSETELYPPLFERLRASEKIGVVWKHKGRLASVPFFNRALRQAKVLLVDSEFTRRELLKSAPGLESKIRVVPLGIHPDRIPGFPPSRDFDLPLKILSVGRLTRTKGMHVALDALSQLRDRSWRWTLVGVGPELENLKSQCQSLSLGEKVDFVGSVDDERLNTLRGEHHLLLFPELGFPAFGLVALEALLSGLPVLASNRGAIPEVVQSDCGWLVAGDDPGAWAKKIDHLIKNPEEIRSRAGQCRELAMARFSFDFMIRKTLDAYNQIAGCFP